MIYWINNFKICSSNTSNSDTPGYIKPEEAEQIVSTTPEGGEPEELSDTGKIVYIKNHL